MSSLLSLLTVVAASTAVSSPAPTAAHDARVTPPALDSASAPKPMDPTERSVRAVLASKADHLSIERRRALARALIEEARRHRIDVAVLLAVITTESRFDPRAVSPVGARGLMQLLPNTARSFAARANVRWRGPQTLFDPIANVRIGAAYLAWLLHRFDGQMTHALASYCYGPARIRRRLAHTAVTHTEYTNRIANALSQVRPHFVAPAPAPEPEVVVPDAALAAVDATASDELWGSFLFERYVSTVAEDAPQEPTLLLTSS